MKNLLMFFAFMFIAWGCTKDPLSISNVTGVGKNVTYVVTGNISDIDTHQPIPGVDVSVHVVDGIVDGMTRNTQTNSSGDFQIAFTDYRDYLIYWAYLVVGETPGKNYQLGLTVNGKEECRRNFGIEPKGDYSIRLLPPPCYRLQMPDVPPDWNEATLTVSIGEKNTNCSDTLIYEKRVIHLNNTAEMNVLKNIRKIERSNKLTIDYNIKLNNVVKFTRRFYPECPYGDTTWVNLTLN